MKSITLTQKEESAEFYSGLEVISPNIYVHENVCKVINTVQNKIKDKEISILFKSSWSKYGYNVSGDEYIIPEQIVSSTSVDYKDEGAHLYALRQQGYNTVMHSHPWKGINLKFSGDDDKYINSHFPCSILCNIDSDIVLGTLLLKTDNDQNRLRIEVDSDDIYILKDQIEVEGISNISIKETTITVVKKTGDNGHWDGHGYTGISTDAEVKEYIEDMLKNLEFKSTEEIEEKRQELYDYWGVI